MYNDDGFNESAMIICVSPGEVFTFRRIYGTTRVAEDATGTVGGVRPGRVGRQGLQKRDAGA